MFSRKNIFCNLNFFSGKQMYTKFFFAENKIQQRPIYCLQTFWICSSFTDTAGELLTKLTIQLVMSVFSAEEVF